MVKGPECRAKDFGIYPGSNKEPCKIFFFISGIIGLKLHFRKIKPVEEWMMVTEDRDCRQISLRAASSQKKKKKLTETSY